MTWAGEKFLKRVWDWKTKYGGRIVSSRRSWAPPATCAPAASPWTRAFPRQSAMCLSPSYKKGLIYKGSRIINWCPNCVTALSDAEVEYQDKPGSSGHIRYPIQGEEGRYVIVATTRPETMLGDTGVAVNPNDEQTRTFGGQEVHPAPGGTGDAHCGRRVRGHGVRHRLREDDPAHDPNDFEVGLRQNLETIRVLDHNGKVVEGYGRYSGMDRYEARKAIVHDLEEGGWLVKVEPHQHNVGTCYRCHSDVEPLISAQWFVKMEPRPRRPCGWSTTARSSSSPTALPRPIPTGWRTSMTGGFPASCGGGQHPAWTWGTADALENLQALLIESDRQMYSQKHRIHRHFSWVAGQSADQVRSV